VSGFVDEAQLHVKGGDGGAGAVAFRHEAHVPRGGPAGGDGGDGGDVLLQAVHDVASLLAFKDHPHRRAEDGGHGRGSGRDGPRGRDEVVEVPVGTVVKDRNGEVLADLVAPGSRWLAARGGRGGRGNAHFLSNRRRAPSFAERGEPGEERWLALELKLMADVALVGFPNAGKSTLISRVSAAKPKVADYPFTTLVPHLGVVRFDEHEFVLADVPGLIEGASEGRGLGHRFLRHVERARVLLLLLDLAPADGRSPRDQEKVLLRELSRYQPALLERRRLVVGTKADLVAQGGPGNAWGGSRVSALTGEGLPELLGRLAELVARSRADEPESESFVVHRPLAEGFSVRRSGDGYVVTGRPVERAVAMNDLTNPEAIEYVQHRLERLGVNRALARAGARPGDVVRIGDATFEYQPDD
jgi:GTP-binding protein